MCSDGNIYKLPFIQYHGKNRNMMFGFKMYNRLVESISSASIPELLEQARVLRKMGWNSHLIEAIVGKEEI